MTRLLGFPLAILCLAVSLTWPLILFDAWLGMMMYEKATAKPPPPQVTVHAAPSSPSTPGVCWQMPNGGTGDPVTVCWSPPSPTPR